MMLSKNVVSFPGIGIENFELDNVAFTIGEGFRVYWYGVIITLGIILAFIYASFRAKYEKIKVDDLIDVALWTVILGVIGARLYYVLTTLENYIPEPFNLGQFFKNVFNLRQGGLAIYGGIICGILGIVISTKIKKMNTIKLMDMAGPGVMIAQSLGRWGNFFNREAFGDYTDGLLAMQLPVSAVRSGEITEKMWENMEVINGIEFIQVHPTFLYEGLWNLGVLMFLFWYRGRKKFQGELVLWYLVLYGAGRFWIEALRTDQLLIPGIGFPISQLLGLVLAVSGVIVIIIGHQKVKKSSVNA